MPNFSHLVRGPLPSFSSLFLLRTDTALSGSSRECEKTTLFTMNWREDGCCWVGGRHFPVSLTQLTQSPKNAPHPPRMERGWPAEKKALSISSRRLSFRFVVVVVRPIMKTAKRKFMFRCFFCRVMLGRQKGRLHLFPPSSPRRRRGETIPAQFHFKSGRV